MTTACAGAAIALVALGLSACEDGASFRLHNATAAAMAVLPQERGHFPRTIHVDPGENAKLYIRRGYSPEGGRPWRSPDGTRPDYSYHYPIEVQVEHDLKLYLLPAKAKGLLPLDALKQRQVHGFPLKPVSKTCR